mgnify:CR=1 FL=1
MLLQLLDDGRLTDGQGRTVDFTNVILIMTSNLPGDPHDFFRPEFINRIDEVVVFHALDEKNIAMHALRIPSTSLNQSQAMQIQVEKTISAKSPVAARTAVMLPRRSISGARPSGRFGILTAIVLPVGRFNIHVVRSPGPLGTGRITTSSSPWTSSSESRSRSSYSLLVGIRRAISSSVIAAFHVSTSALSR